MATTFTFITMLIAVVALVKVGDFLIRNAGEALGLEGSEASIRNSQAGIAHTANGGLGTQQTTQFSIQEKTNSNLVETSDKSASQDGQ